MEIKTKFEIGDVVWFMHGNEPHKGQIEELRTQAVGVKSESKPPIKVGSGLNADGFAYSVQIQAKNWNGCININYVIKFMDEDGEIGSGTLNEKDVYATKNELRDHLFSD